MMSLEDLERNEVTIEDKRNEQRLARGNVVQYEINTYNDTRYLYLYLDTGYVISISDINKIIEHYMTEKLKDKK